MAEEELEERICGRHTWRSRRVQTLNSGKVSGWERWSGRGPARDGSRRATAAASSAAGRHLRANACGCHQLVRGVTIAPAQQPPVLLCIKPFRSGAAEPHDRCALYGVFDGWVGVVLVVLRRHVQAVAREFNPIYGQAPFAANILRECDTLTVAERTCLAGDFDRYGRVVRALDAKDADGLEIRPGVGGGRHVPGAEVVLDVARGKAEARRVEGAALQIVRGDKAQPLLEVLAVDRLAPARGGGRYRGQEARGDGKPEN